MKKINFKEIISYLEKKEKEHDKLIALSRNLIRTASNSIKLMHSNNLQEAKKNLSKLSKDIKAFSHFSEEYKYLVDPIAQEYVEAALLLAALEKKPFPNYKKLNVSPQAYLLGLLDLFGELKREVILSLLNNQKERAWYLFNIMSELFDELLVIRFSNSILPNFKRKLDIAKIQLEDSRIELLKAGLKISKRDGK
ncbi:MAG: hypothetical protein ACK4J0_01210 [Candidatus Anstonellaceae archaeon]